MLRFRKSEAAFNAHHSPVGAFASFTLGYPGPSGGLGLELGGPARESIFIGVEKSGGGGYQALPFFGSSADSSRRYDVGSSSELVQGVVQPFSWNRITRDFGLGSDTWIAGDLTFTIYSAPKTVPEPGKSSRAARRRALVPAVFAELKIDNRKGRRERTAFFGYEGSHPFFNTRRLDDVAGGKFTGVGQGPVTALVSNSPGVISGSGFTLDQILRPDHPHNRAFGLGGVGALLAAVPAGEERTFRFAICFFRDGVATSGLPMYYAYTGEFSSIEDVAMYALAHWVEQADLAREADKIVGNSLLHDDQKFQICHAVRSYYGSTEFLATTRDEPFWAVNEGEYRMINTFDLTVDHLFFELDRNPWVVRNQLDWFVKRYSYHDKVRLPDDPAEYPGGISFTHDMGIGNCLSRPGHSSYEKFGIHGCFSHMTQEQLVNWVCCAVSYARATGDHPWVQANLRIFRACLKSLENRDHPDPRQRDGVMSADSSRCGGGSEITTYDSLDASLGQARNNLYLAVKTWAAYVGLAELFREANLPGPAGRADRQAALCAKTIVSHARPDGFIPAIMGEGNTARIIPAIEGLVFPKIWGLSELLADGGKFADLGAALARHLHTVLRPGVCLFPDGGWKLSSTNPNSWLSKIYLSQYVARTMLGQGFDAGAEHAHAHWLLDPENAFFSWSDQMVSGKAKGSKYYPRGVTSWLWLSEDPR